MASQSCCSSSGMDRIRAAENHDESTLEATTRSWDEEYVRSATVFHTSAAFRLVNAMDRFSESGDPTASQDAVRRRCIDTPTC